jgi:UPF0348 protein CLORAM_00077
MKKIIGVIAEYNPFHLGHRYQIEKIKELYPDSIIIAIISTNFTQRGDISLLNKWNKATICLNEGIDLVIELPTLYATQSADIFAYGAISILNKFKIDTLVFGSETNDIDSFTTLANIQINNPKYPELVKNYLSLGLNYPTAMSKALKELTNTKIDKPNDLLALSYIKEIIKNNYPITPISIKRTNDYHSNSLQNNTNIINASLIREMFLNNQDISPYIPNNTKELLYQYLSLNKAYTILKYNIINNENNLSTYLDIEEGLDKRILKYLDTSHTWIDLVNNLKTKRYTYNKINRTLLHLLLNIKKEDNTKEIYLRVLGFNNKGREYLKKLKKDTNLDIFTSYRKNKSPLLDLEYHSTYIYSLITNDSSLIKREYQSKPIILK